MQRAATRPFYSSRMRAARIAVLGFAASLLGAQHSHAQTEDALGIIERGDLVVTGFSGTIAPDPNEPLPPSTTIIDETFIDLDGASAEIFDVSTPGYVWDGRYWEHTAKREITAGEIGQVFGIALDDFAPANIYLTATSAFGLQIVVADQDNDGRPERVKTGQPGAFWMSGQFGADPAAGPGTIYRVDGISGEVSLFANIELDGEPNSGPGLGDIVFDPVSQQLFVSDLDTGMIHRLDLSGNDLEHFDHGVDGRNAAQLPATPFDPASRLDITTSDFDSEDPDSWAFTAPERRVWGLGVHEGRLYYAVAEGPQIWSVGIAEDGSFAGDPRWELDVWNDGPPLEVSDMVFSNLGAMILAQRGERNASYDYSTFMKPRRARVYRYWLEDSNDPATESAWILEPEEYAVGFPPDYRNANGGVDLGFGYSELGEMDFNVCEVSLWTTGESLRRNEQLRTELLEGGPETVHGVQGSPALPVRDFNTPPWASYMLDFDGDFEDPQAAGHMGDVELPGCRGEIETVYYFGGPGYTWPMGDDYTVPSGDDGDDPCPDAPYCGDPPSDDPPSDDPPSDEPPSDEPEACMAVTGDLQCDAATGDWIYTFSVADNYGLGLDGAKVLSLTPPIPSPGIVNISPASVSLPGAAPGQTVDLLLCAFNQADAATGDPFDCCRQTVRVTVPAQACPAP